MPNITPINPSRTGKATRAASVGAPRLCKLISDGTVAGTVFLLKDSGLDESNIERLLSALDDKFLPDVDLEHGNLTYTVVLGEVLGN